MKIFVSYRHNDKPEIVQLITRELSNREQINDVFHDIFSIPPGIDFEDYIISRIKQCDTVLVIVGKKWGELFAQKAENEEYDYVLLEVKTALQFNVLTVPILIDGANVPEEGNLPREIRAFKRRNAVKIRAGKDFDNDINDLLDTLINALNFQKGIEELNVGKRLLELQNADLQDIWRKTQAHIYNQFYNSTDQMLRDLPRLLHNTEIISLDFHTIVYSTDDIETFKYLNTADIDQLLEQTLTKVVGVQLFSVCKLQETIYYEEYDSYTRYLTIKEWNEEQQRKDVSSGKSDVDDIPF